MPARSISQRVRDVRTRLGWTLDEIQEEFHIDRMVWHRWEAGKHAVPRVGVLAILLLEIAIELDQVERLRRLIRRNSSLFNS